jgi:hypothetical protein
VEEGGGEGRHNNSHGRAEVLHHVVFRLDVGSHGEELVDEAELTKALRPVEDGLARLRWARGGGAAVEALGGR